MPLNQLRQRSTKSTSRRNANSITNATTTASPSAASITTNTTNNSKKMKTQQQQKQQQQGKTSGSSRNLSSSPRKKASRSSRDQTARTPSPATAAAAAADDVHIDNDELGPEDDDGVLLQGPPKTILKQSCEISTCSTLEETYSNLKASYSNFKGLADAPLSPTGSQLDGSNDNDTDNDYGDNAKDDSEGKTEDEVASQHSSTVGHRSAMSASDVKKDESKALKIAIRFSVGILMMVVFLTFLFSGHIYVCGIIFFTEVMLFKELVKVRYNTFFHIIEETIPLFRTTQWMWFVTATFYTYSDFVIEVIKSNTSLHYLLDIARFMPGFSFILYSATFVLTIATMHKDHIRFQLNQLCWTILVLCLTVGQLKYINHNVFNGLIWFALPFMLVVSNDSYAWLAGITCGRKFIQRPFLSLSPNKTWEGFIGGGIGTIISSWYYSYWMAQFTWMTCPNNNFSFFPGPLECELDPIFHEATYIFPPQIFDLFPKALVQTMFSVVNICMVNGDSNDLTACVSGEENQTHHHFEMVLRCYPIQIHALGLALFASFVAPFGGFLASAIKRAYGIKDFASIIPGHGGLMDRMDCQFLMALCTWVHYNTFVKLATVSVPKTIYMYKLLKESEQEEFLNLITELSKNG